MSFGDFASSGRGPGAIGLLMGLLVLGGFGAIYVFVFNADLEGSGNSLEAVIRQQQMEIEDHKHQIETNRLTANEVDKIEKKNVDVDALISKAEADARKIEELKARIAPIQESILNTTKAMNTYVAGYRSFIRNAAVGEEIAELTTGNGKSYKNAQVRAVSEIGIEIRHDDGIGRVPFEDLPADWQQRFQFDPEEKAKAIARERAAEDLYNQALQAAAEDSKEVSINPEIPVNPTQLDRAIRLKTLELSRLKQDLNRLTAEAVKIETADSIGRASGNSKATQIRGLRGRSQALESKIAALAREISALRGRKQP